MLYTANFETHTRSSMTLGELFPITEPVSITLLDGSMIEARATDDGLVWTFKGKQIDDIQTLALWLDDASFPEFRTKLPDSILPETGEYAIVARPQNYFGRKRYIVCLEWRKNPQFPIAVIVMSGQEAADLSKVLGREVYKSGRNGQNLYFGL